ncbi:LmeA family phospholipid-binding protein [Roseofilum capinflatum]|uniref:DUF2993 domain-containing protein n=1 Tax=Roseofilum capinflatum BLCC-M114 TaxID=3022440 RepID=A0ABT7B694_9CYAN|nr:DUF2993 domain-containing protein [Roseofilum capinflatum]MDJ1174051.1 DUF2993 domain-containing protein [Roseofilum capinflatum BLCC-M114]
MTPAQPREIETRPGSKHGLISRVLSPALQLWLRSQAEEIHDLHLRIDAGDRQILSGLIPHVAVQASQAIYQGLHLSQLQLEADTIRTNLPQVLRRKPLRLLDPILVKGQLQITAQQLQDSLTPGGLLSQGLTEFLRELLKASQTNGGDRLLATSSPQWHTITLGHHQLSLEATWPQPDDPHACLKINSNLDLIQGHLLHFHSLTIDTPPGWFTQPLDSLDIELGTEVALEQLHISPEKIFCIGQITVLP